MSDAGNAEGCCEACRRVKCRTVKHVGIGYLQWEEGEKKNQRHFNEEWKDKCCLFKIEVFNENGENLVSLHVFELFGALRVKLMCGT